MAIHYRLFCPLDGTELVLHEPENVSVCILHGRIEDVTSDDSFYETTFSFTYRKPIAVTTRHTKTSAVPAVISDDIGKPSHYNQYEGFEVIDVCRQLRNPQGEGNWERGNAFKYLARAGWKNPDTEIEDLKKAASYIQREIERLERLAVEKPAEDEEENAHHSHKKYYNPTCRVCSGSTAIENMDAATRFNICRDHPDHGGFAVSYAELNQWGMRQRCWICSGSVIQTESALTYRCASQNSHGRLKVNAQEDSLEWGPTTR